MVNITSIDILFSKHLNYISQNKCDVVIPVVWSHSVCDTAGTGAAGRSDCVVPEC